MLILLSSIIFLSHILTIIPLGICDGGMIEMLFVFTVVSVICGIIMAYLWKDKFFSIRVWTFSYCITYSLFVLLQNSYLLMSCVYAFKSNLVVYKYFDNIYGGEYGSECFVLLCFLILQVVVAFASSQYCAHYCVRCKSSKAYLSVAFAFFVTGFAFQPIGARMFPDPYNIRYLPRLESYVTWQRTNSGLQVKVSKKESFENPCVLNLHFSNRTVLIDIYKNGAININPTECEVINKGIYSIGKRQGEDAKREAWNTICLHRCDHFCFEYGDSCKAIKNPGVWSVFNIPFPYERERYFYWYYNKVLYE